MRKDDILDEELFCQTYGVETFEEAQEAFQDKEDEVFEGEDYEFDEWLERNKGQDEVLCWLWDADCGFSGSEGFCDEVRWGFGEVNLKTVKLHANDLRFHLDENWD